jgi:hypothetical protein
VKLKYFHDFTGNPSYPLPFVLVYHGSVVELTNVVVWCKDNLEHLTYNVGAAALLNETTLTNSYHFLNKKDAMRCRLSHE